MSDILQKTKRGASILVKLLPILSFIIPFVLLYSLYPESFEMTWKGRTFHLFFLWLISLETILNWEKLQTSRIGKIRSIRTVVFITALVLPTIYVIAANYWGLNSMLSDLARKNMVYIESVRWVPLFAEYLVFTVLYALIVLLEYGMSRLPDFSLSMTFLGLIGLVYTIDTLYPFERFTPFQIFVPTTATLAANILNLMGYQTRFLPPQILGVPLLEAENSKGSASFNIAWPCSGVESLLIYTVTILLFLKNTAISWRHRIVYFIIGAFVTYFINILRVATIFVIQINEGDLARQRFHDYYGQLYSITWIIFYPLIIIGSQTLWRKIRNRKASIKSA